MAEENEEGYTYHHWLTAANRFVMEHAGVQITDLPDPNFRESWLSGEDPIDFAKELLEQEGFQMEDEDG